MPKLENINNNHDLTDAAKTHFEQRPTKQPLSSATTLHSRKTQRKRKRTGNECSLSNNDQT